MMLFLWGFVAGFLVAGVIWHLQSAVAQQDVWALYDDLAEYFDHQLLAQGKRHQEELKRVRQGEDDWWKSL